MANHVFITSDYIIDELITYIKAVRPKLSHKWAKELKRKLLDFSRDYSNDTGYDIRDINDIPILQLAIEHNAFIVTGDKDLLEYKETAKVAILSLAEYEELFL